MSETAWVEGELRQHLVPERWSSRLIYGLRWLALVVALTLSFFDRSQEGIFIPAIQMFLMMAGYNLLILFLARYLAWLRRLLNLLAVDAIVTTLAVYLTGGFHSGFFILYFFIVIGAAFSLNLTSTTLLALTIGGIYTGACFVNPAGIWGTYAIHILAAKLALLLIVALLCGLLLEELRRERQETEREKALTARLSTLNDLFKQLSTSLDLDHTLQTLVEASRRLLGADATFILLRDEKGQGLYPAAASGVALQSFFLEGHLALNEGLIGTIIETGEPYVIEDVSQHPDIAPPVLFKEGIISLAGVSLFLDGEIIGILCAGKRTPRAFTEEGVAFLDALGREAALAIRNARLYQRERWQVEQLQALEKLRSNFISAVSHELRTPLTCIRTSVDLLRETGGENFPEAQGELLQTITHHTDRLEALVTDLLDSTRLEAGQLSLSLQSTDLRPIVERTVAAISPLMEKKQQVIELNLPSTLSLVLVDRHRIEQVLTNLLSNAHKFSPKRGRIHVALTERGDHLEVSVRDRGPGVLPEEKERIFDKFYVVANGQDIPGVGLGLYIARQLVELHGGRIWVESDRGKGSTFRFTIPKVGAE